MMKMMSLILILLTVGEILLGIKIGYPATEDQLLFGNLWLVRISSLVLLIGGMCFFYKILRDKFNKLEIGFCFLFIIGSPTFFSSWYNYPLNSIKIFLLLFLVWFLLKSKINKKLIFLILSIGLILFNFSLYKEKAEIFNKLDLKDAKNEVTERFSSEDSLTYQVKFPLLFRRLSYNKYFFEFKILIKDFVNYFDLETNFFQEIHPAEQKSWVIFYWPAIYLFFIGSWIIIKNKKNSLFVLLFGLSIINFYFSKESPSTRNLLNLIPIGLLVGVGANHLISYISKKNYFIFKFVAVITLVFNIYSLANGFYDVQKRPQHWFDNRPVAFNFMFEGLKNQDINKYEHVYITTLFGDSKKFCKYYFEDCQNPKIVFDSFDLKDKPAENGSLYIGFAGEFIGKDFFHFPNNWEKLIVDRGFVVIDRKMITDNIANGFGDYIVLAKK